MYDDDYGNEGTYDPECHGVSRRDLDNPDSPYYDQPCPRCGRREGAYEAGECTPCGYVSGQALHERRVNAERRLLASDEGMYSELALGVGALFPR